MSFSQQVCSFMIGQPLTGCIRSKLWIQNNQAMPVQMQELLVGNKRLWTIVTLAAIQIYQVI